jgi:mono/diheme cytochrome c family protein
LAAGVWLGGLPPLWIVVARAPADVAWRAARRFSPVGILCVGVLLATAIYQGWVLLGGIPGLFGTAYGWVALVKISLFGVLGILAARNRFRHTPGLQGASAIAARRMLGRNIAWETAAGVVISLAAGVLTELPPAMHALIVWPFPYRISFDAVSEDADLRAEVLKGAILAGLGVVAILGLAASAMWRRHSLAGRAVHGTAALVALGVIAVAAPHLDLLFVPAVPTQYYRSPTHFSVASIMRGAALYGPNCAACHGAEGRGDGPAAKGLSVPPANLTAAHLWMHADGELFWWLAHGIQAPDGSQAMPGFASILSNEDRWNLIDMIRARNAGLSMAGGTWTRFIPAPSFGMLCEGGVTRQMSDLSGQVVRLVVGAPAQALAGMVTVTTASVQPGPGVCVAQDTAIGPAYALAAGLAGDARGAVFLIDPRGVLRMVWPGGSAPSPGALAAAASMITAATVIPAAQAGAKMNMDDMNMDGMKM